MYEKKRPKKAAPVDWHSADIVAALRKAGWSLRKLAAHHNYRAPTTLCKAIEQRWPKGERLIAEAIGVHPATIWPSRYQGKDSTLTDKEKTNKEAA